MADRTGLEVRLQSLRLAGAATKWPQADARDKLAAYAALYSGVLDGGRMCLCGMLAAEYETLPKPMGEAIVRFFDANHAWAHAGVSAGQGRQQARVRRRSR